MTSDSRESLRRQNALDAVDRLLASGNMRPGEFALRLAELRIVIHNAFDDIAQQRQEIEALHKKSEGLHQIANDQRREIERLSDERGLARGQIEALKRERETIVAHACTECPKTVACKGLGYCGLQHPDREALERERDDACSERDDAIRIAQSAKTAHLSTKADNAALRARVEALEAEVESGWTHAKHVAERDALQARCDEQSKLIGELTERNRAQAQALQAGQSRKQT